MGIRRGKVGRNMVIPPKKKNVFAYSLICPKVLHFGRHPVGDRGAPSLFLTKAKRGGKRKEEEPWQITPW